MAKILFVSFYASLLLALNSECKPPPNPAATNNSTGGQKATNTLADNVVNNPVVANVFDVTNRTVKELQTQVFDALDNLITAVRGSPGNKENGVISELIGQNFLNRLLTTIFSQNGAPNQLVDRAIFYPIAGGATPKGERGKNLDLGIVKTLLSPVIANDYGFFDNNADYFLYRLDGRGNTNEKLD